MCSTEVLTALNNANRRSIFIHRSKYLAYRQHIIFVTKRLAPKSSISDGCPQVCLSLLSNIQCFTLSSLTPAHAPHLLLAYFLAQDSYIYNEHSSFLYKHSPPHIVIYTYLLLSTTCQQHIQPACVRSRYHQTTILCKLSFCANNRLICDRNAFLLLVLHYTLE